MKRWRKLRAMAREAVNDLTVRLGTWVQYTRLRADAGQTVAEYALVLLVAAAVAAAFLLWAKQSGKLDSFFNLIFDKLVNSVDPSGSPSP